MLFRYTSEDASSFLRIQEQDQNRIKERIKWMFNQADRANQLNSLAIESEGKGDVKMIEYKSHNFVPVEPSNDPAVPSSTEVAVIYSSGQGKVSKPSEKSNNQVALIANEVVRPPHMQICESEAKPNLFFTPEDNYQKVIQLDDIDVVHDKVISRNNTRLPTEFYAEFSNYKPSKKQQKNNDESEKQSGPHGK